MGADAQTATAMGVEHSIKASGFTVKMVACDFNERIHVLNYEAEDPRAMIRGLMSEARLRDYGKIFLKAPAFDRRPLEDAGMVFEATITGYYSGQPAAVMSLYLNEGRMQRPFESKQREILEAIESRDPDSSASDLPDGYHMEVATAADVEELAALYSTVFESYPYPITNPAYLKSTMSSHVLYRIVRNAENVIVAAASAETCPRHRNAEMTYFATLPSERGLGLAQHILAALEDDMREWALPNLYTIARARSAGMNRVFYNRGYSRTGTLVNNCHIAGDFEDMHVWCKSVEPAVQN
jgi:putative beta-lysine N-acetyltransferase